MRTRLSATALFTITLLALAGPAPAALRCGTDLISSGDSVLTLLDACGEPTYGDPAFYLGSAQWTYNFGPNQFMMRVIIRNGKVERVEQLGWGFATPETQGAQNEGGGSTSTAGPSPSP